MLEYIFGTLILLVTIGIISIVGTRTAYEMAYNDYEKNLYEVARELAENANVQIHHEILLIDETRKDM